MAQGIGSLALNQTVHRSVSAPKWTVLARRLIKNLVQAIFIRYRYYMLVPVPVLEREVLALAQSVFTENT